MKRSLVVCLVALMALLTGGNALAENLRGRFGVTGKAGVIIPADSDRNDAAIPDKVVVETDAGFTGGGGLIYGVDDHVAIELDVYHSQFHAQRWGTAKVNNVSFGAQYRFEDKQRLVPYLGAGIDVLMPDFSGLNVDTVMGVHLAGGIDYFLGRDLAVTVELRGVEAFDSDVTNPAGIKQGNFDPSSLTATVGVRFFFN